MDIDIKVIWLIIGFLTWAFLFYFDSKGRKNKSYSVIIKELILNTLFGPITTFFLIVSIILSEELRSSILNKLKR